MPWYFAPPVAMMLGQLGNAQRSKIRAVLEHLATSPDPANHPGVSTIRVGQEMVNVLRVGRYSIFFTKRDGRLTVIDIATDAQIDFLRAPAKSSAA